MEHDRSSPVPNLSELTLLELLALIPAPPSMKVPVDLSSFQSKPSVMDCPVDVSSLTQKSPDMEE